MTAPAINQPPELPAGLSNVRRLEAVMSQQGTADAVSADGEWVLLVRARSGDGGLDELLLDRETLADLVLEAIEESQRTRGARAQTTWWDAAAAADLIRFHVTNSAADQR
jgi:hypothetical protein